MIFWHSHWKPVPFSGCLPFPRIPWSWPACPCPDGARSWPDDAPCSSPLRPATSSSAAQPLACPGKDSAGEWCRISVLQWPFACKWGQQVVIRAAHSASGSPGCLKLWMIVVFQEAIREWTVNHHLVHWVLLLLVNAIIWLLQTDDAISIACDLGRPFAAVTICGMDWFLVLFVSIVNSACEEDSSYITNKTLPWNTWYSNSVFILENPNSGINVK